MRGLNALIGVSKLNCRRIQFNLRSNASCKALFGLVSLSETRVNARVYPDFLLLLDSERHATRRLGILDATRLALLDDVANEKAGIDRSRVQHVMRLCALCKGLTRRICALPTVLVIPVDAAVFDGDHEQTRMAMPP